MSYGGKFCYPGTNVLINKYDIRDGEILDKFEVQKTLAKLMGLHMNPEYLKKPCNIEYLKKLNAYIFGDIYEWAGNFRQENIIKFEAVLSGGQVKYADPQNIEEELESIFEKYSKFDWSKNDGLIKASCDLLVSIWLVHPFREGNTRTCTTFLWEYLLERGVYFNSELFRLNPKFVRNALVVYVYGQCEPLERIMKDALEENLKKQNLEIIFDDHINDAKETYKITKKEYEVFKEKYRIQKK